MKTIVVIKKYVLDGIVELLKEYDARENEVYDNLLNRTPIEQWRTLKDLAPFEAQVGLKQIKHSLEPEYQKSLKEEYIAEQPECSVDR